MTTWAKIYSKVRLTSADGFTFATMPNITWPQEDADEFLKHLLPADKQNSEMAFKRALVDPKFALRMYLCETMSSTFCIGYGDRNNKSVFYIGARRPQDIFKLLLRLPNISKTNSWPRDMTFFVRVAENDDYDPEKHMKGIQPQGIA